jgi:hypothetical protein
MPSGPQATPREASIARRVLDLPRRLGRRRRLRREALPPIDERWATRALLFDTLREILSLTLRAAVTVYLIKLMIEGTPTTALLTAAMRALH